MIAEILAPRHSAGSLAGPWLAKYDFRLDTANQRKQNQGLPADALRCVTAHNGYFESTCYYAPLPSRTFARPWNRGVKYAIRMPANDNLERGDRGRKGV